MKPFEKQASKTEEGAKVVESCHSMCSLK
jgi:hypothetical protein